MIDARNQVGRQAPASLHDVLGAWQDGRIPYRRALALTGMKTVTDLYEAAGNSGVDVRLNMSPAEERAARRAVEAIRAVGGTARGR